jgi:hypothetical protein
MSKIPVEEQYFHLLQPSMVSTSQCPIVVAVADADVVVMEEAVTSPCRNS